MNGLEIYLKNGAVVTVDASDLKTRRSPVTGELAEITWTTPEGARRKLHMIDVAQVAAVVVIR